MMTLDARIIRYLVQEVGLEVNASDSVIIDAFLLVPKSTDSNLFLFLLYF